MNNRFSATLRGMVGAASLKASSSDEISDNLSLIASGMFFIMHGGS